MNEMNERPRFTFQEFKDCYEEVLHHSGIGSHFLKDLHRKLEHEIFDSGDYFFLTNAEDRKLKLKAVVSNEDGLKASNPSSIFLIDHAWTYQLSNARKHLCEIPGLVQRLAELLGYSVHGEVFGPDDDIVNAIMRDMWKYNQTYSITQGSKSKLPVWYMLDEFGSHIQHSDNPTVLVVPFFYQPLQTSFSLLVPLVDLNYGDELTRDYTNSETNILLKKCKLLPWFPSSLEDCSSSPKKYKIYKYQERFQMSGETLPGTEDPHSSNSDNNKLRTFMNLKERKFLTDPNFELVSEEKEADVVFKEEKCSDFRVLSEERPHTFINQFPCEQLLFRRDFFMDLCQRSSQFEKLPMWAPLSFNLKHELPQFVAHFQSQQGSGKNVWIMKPWHAKTRMVSQVTNNLDEIIRSTETDEPMIVCKYEEEPILLKLPDTEGAVKFDLKFHVLVNSIQPLNLYTSNVFYARVCPKPFTLTKFDDQGKHCTDSSETNMNSAEFIHLFEEQYPNHKWEDIQKQINKCIAKLFLSATSKEAPLGVGHYSKSRALYGADILLAWKTDNDTGAKYIQPIFLECNSMPNLSIPCRFNPQFLNEVFQALFLGETSNVIDIADS